MDKPFARLCALILVIGLTAPACGVIERRREQRERVSRAVEAGIEAGTARYRITADWQRRPTRSDRLARIATPEPLTIEGLVDLTSNRALASIPGGASSIALYDDSIIYVPRAGSAAAEGEVVGLEFDNRRLRSLGGEDALGFVWINPAYLYRLADGAVAETIREAGPPGADGLTHYRAGVDRDTAIRGRLEGMQQSLLNQLSAMNVDTASYRDSEFWVDATGVLRKLQVTLVQELNADNHFDVTLTMELLDVGVTADMPAPSVTRLAESFSELTRGVIQARR